MAARIDEDFIVKQEYFHDSFGGQASEEDIASTVLLVGDPLLVRPLAERMMGSARHFEHYEFNGHTGTMLDRQTTLMSTGIGGGSASIGIDNLAALGVKTLVYLGSLLGKRNGFEIDVPLGAARLDGASLDYAPLEYPAAADPALVINLMEEATAAGYSAGTSMLIGPAGPLSEEERVALEAYQKDISGSSHPCFLSEGDPEVATLFTLSTLYGLRAGAIYRRTRSDKDDLGSWTELAGIAVKAIRLLEPSSG